MTISKFSLFGLVVKKIQSSKNYSASRFVSELPKIDQSPVLISNDVDYCLDEFSRLFRSVIDFVALVCDIRVK